MTHDDREQRIIRMVQRFYELVADFWSHALYGTGRYKGNPFAAHRGFDFPIEAFPAWLTAFTQAVEETLTADEAATALRRARLMADSIKAGLFPYIGPDGQPSRTPPGS